MTQSTIPAIPFRIRIGITGHRSLEEPEALRRCIDDILSTRWQEAYSAASRTLFTASANTPTAFTAISPIAEGADRLLAETILARPLGRLEVPLPMVREEYLKDFDTEASRQKFDELLGAATQTWCSTSGDRNEQYLQVGVQVVEQCDILVGIWDGKPARGKGGTAEIIKSAIEMKKPVFVISTVKPHGITLHNAGTLEAHGLHELELYNDSPLTSDLIAQSKEEQQGIFKHPEAASIPAMIRNHIADCLTPHFAKADASAVVNQNAYQLTGSLSYSVSTVAVAFMAIAIVFGKSPWVATTCYVAELVALIALFMMIHRAEKKHVHIKWLQNRALAERIRSLIFFVACGVKPAESAINPGSYLKDWSGRVLTELRDGTPWKQFASDSKPEERVAFLLAAWISAQQNYHQGKTVKSGDKNKKLMKISFRLFALAIGVSAIHLVTSLAGMMGHHPSHLVEIIEELLTVVAVTLPAAAAAVGGYRILMEYARISARCASMAEQLGQLVVNNAAIKTTEGLATLLRQGEDIMLAESKEWISLLKHADLERIA